MTKFTNGRRLLAISGASVLAMTVGSNAWAGPTAACVVGVGGNATECGVGSVASGFKSIAVGKNALAAELKQPRLVQVLRQPEIRQPPPVFFRKPPASDRPPMDTTRSLTPTIHRHSASILKP